MSVGKRRREKGSAKAVQAFLLGLLGRVIGAAISSWWNNQHNL
ncbi:hypothetical protein [Streptomyces puniciscabiei]